MMINNDPEYISHLLDVNPKAVERGIVLIYQRQTDDEQQANTTKHRNGIGFRSCDARMGSYLACWVLSGRHLTGQWLDRARRMCHVYIRQLVEEATIKIEREEEMYLKLEREGIQHGISK